MDVFELSARLTLDTSEYEKSLNGAEAKTESLGGSLGEAAVKTASLGQALDGTETEAASLGQALDGTETEATSLGQALDGTETGTNQFTSALKALFVTAGKTYALKKSAEAVYNLGKAAVSSYADYEQLVGGVETLFKSSAKKVQQYAQNAYKTAGLSANDYMETVTSFSAFLLQSLGNDTEKAAEMADMAITDMADNVNKMGTNMQDIQNAYQGFAKQNYTMLDNLKIGYGGTKTEMERLLQDAEALKAKQGEVTEYSIDSFADIVEAIHVVQTEMGITGATSLEAAETISGSFASAKASVGNLLTAMVDADQDIIAQGQETAEALKTAFWNAGEAIGSLMSVGIRAIEDAVDPVNRVSRAIEGIEEAQERISAADNVLQLVSKYRQLQEATEDSNLSASEVSEIETELISIRQQLATATGNAKIAQAESNDEVEQAVKYEEALAQAEKEREGLELYKEVTKGAKAYKEELAKLKTKSEELKTAEDRLNYTLDNRIPAAESLTDTLDELWESFEEGALTQESLRAGLDELEETILNLTGIEVDFTDLLSAQDYIDGLDLSFVGLGENVQEAQGKVNGLETEVNELTISTEAFRAQVAALVDNGIIGATEAANYLGIEVSELDTVLASARVNTDGLTEGMEEESNAAEELRLKMVDLAGEAINSISSGENLRAKHEELTGQVENLGGELDQTTLAMVNNALEALNLAATNQELVESYPGFVTAAENAGVALSDLSGWLIDNGVTAEEWGAQVSSAVDGVINDFAEVKTSTGQSVEEMKAALESNISAYTNWNANISMLMDAAVASGDASKIAFVQSMQDLGIGGAEQVAVMAEDIEGTLDEFGPLFKEAADQGMLEVYNSVTSNTAKNVNASRQVSQKSKTAMESINYTPVGTSNMNEVIQGIEQQSGAVSSAAESVASEAKGSAASVSFWSVGYNMAQGMANGLYGGSNAVTSAAYSVARSAYNSACSSLGIRSPSRLFRDKVGKMITEGISVGMTAPDVLRDLKAASGEVTDSVASEMSGMSIPISNDFSAYTGQLAERVEATHGRSVTVNNTVYVQADPNQDITELAQRVSYVLGREMQREAAAFA